jgi:hypothetical protein
MQPLIEDLQKLWKGGPTRDMSEPEKKIQLCIDVMYYTHDYPALGTMSGRVTSGYNACVKCDKEKLATRIINKNFYIGHHCFLPHGHNF